MRFSGDKLSNEIADIYYTAERQIVLEMAKILTKTSAQELDTNNMFQWYLQKMREFNLYTPERFWMIIKEAERLSEGKFEEAIKAWDAYKPSEDETFDIPADRLESASNMATLAKQIIETQWLEMKNHINQTMVTTNYADSIVSKVFQQVLNEAMTLATTGLLPSEEAIKRALYNLSDAGLKSGFYDKSGREWSLESYVRMVVKTMSNRIYNDLRMNQAKEHGLVTALMSVKPYAREACSYIQGKYVLIVPKNEAPPEFAHLPSIYDYGYGTPAGCFGINCGHILYMQLPSDETNIPKPLPPEVAQENAEIVAKQRGLERKIRHYKERLQMAKALNDEAMMLRMQRNIRFQQASVRMLISQNSSLLVRNYPREQVRFKPTYTSEA